MHAFFDPIDGSPKVEVEISGTTPNSKKIKALLDTGHSGSLSLSIIDLIEIGAKLCSYGEVTYANGQVGVVYYFSVNVTIDGETKDVQACMIENPVDAEAIAGLQLFSPYVAFIDFKNRLIGFLPEDEFSEFVKEQRQALK